MAFTYTHKYIIKAKGKTYEGEIVLHPDQTYTSSEVEREQGSTTTEVAAITTFLTAVNTLYGVMKNIGAITIFPKKAGGSVPKS